MIATPWYRRRVSLFVGAVLCAAISFVAINPLMANGAPLGGPFWGTAAFLLPLIPVALLLHFGTPRRDTLSWVSYSGQILFTSLVAAAVGFVLLVLLFWAATGELI